MKDGQVWEGKRIMIGCIYKLLLSFVLLLILSGCSVKTKIIFPDEVIEVHSKSNALVTVKGHNRTIIVNNQGKPTLLEQLLTLMFMDVKVQDEATK